MIRQVDDLRAEAAELHRLLGTLRIDDWPRATQFKAWTIDDIVRHLHIGDSMALASASSPEAFATLMADIRAQREKGLNRVEETRQRLNGLGGPALLERWHTTLEELCTVLAEKPPDTRLTWSGPDMGLRMFTTARQMETWAHGQDVYDLLRVPRVYNDNLRSIAFLGVKTFSFTFENRGLKPPTTAPFVSLTAPSGAIWDYNTPSDAERIEGLASDFCHVVTQNRNVADTQLKVTGEIAQSWMRVAQCFAGRPEDPPAPGQRVGRID